MIMITAAQRRMRNSCIESSRLNTKSTRETNVSVMPALWSAAILVGLGDDAYFVGVGAGNVVLLVEEEAETRQYQERRSPQEENSHIQHARPGVVLSLGCAKAHYTL